MKAAAPQVGGDELAVGQEVRGEHGEEERDERGARVEPRPGPQEQGHGERRGEEDDRETAPEEQPARVVPVVEPAPGEAPDRVLAPGFVRGVHLHLEEEERHRGQAVDERRVVRREAVVVERDVGPGRREVRGLVVRGRGPAHRVDGQADVEGDADRDGEELAPAHGAAGFPADHRIAFLTRSR
jgi:hypothetical protein